MKYNELGKSGLKVSAVGLGTWIIGADMWGKVDDKNSIDAIRQAIDNGINLIDTAPAYGDGHSEEVIGTAIKGLRERVVIVTKCGIVKDDTNNGRKDLSPKSIRKEIEASLSRLGIDYIDIYILHWPDVNTPIEETLDEMNSLKKAGKIIHIGVSNFDEELLAASMKFSTISCLQPQLSILNRDNLGLIEFAENNGIGVLTYGSLAAGMLTGKITKLPEFTGNDARSFFYPFFKEPMFSKSLRLIEVLHDIANEHDKPISSVSINWVIQQKGVSTALVGAKTAEEVKENSIASTWELTKEELQLIDNSYQDIFGSTDR